MALVLAIDLEKNSKRENTHAAENDQAGPERGEEPQAASQSTSEGDYKRVSG